MQQLGSVGRVELCADELVVGGGVGWSMTGGGVRPDKREH